MATESTNHQLEIVLSCMMNRRSYRRFKQEQIAETELESILTAGMYAANAGGRQGPMFVVSQDQVLNARLGRQNREAASGMGQRFVSAEQPSILDDTTLESGFYGAPTVITLFAPAQFLHSVEDCAIAAQNIMLCAHVLGIGSCYVARAEETFMNDFGRECLKQWHIHETYKPFCHVVLGFPDGQTPKPKPRKEGRIIRLSQD